MNNSSTILAYAELQLASESMFGFEHKELPGKTKSGQIEAAWLTKGNGHSSRFSSVQAEKFIKNWALVEHKSNTETGFSGTLFKYIGPSNPGLGLEPNQLVLSFRSTEFIEDAARDNQQTNTLEIKKSGWAFGQISDMESWYASLKTKYASDFAASNNRVDVTGYSLGGHLATAFNLLHGYEARVTYTFNGAGVGRVEKESSLGKGQTLSQVINEFTRRRVKGGNTDLFTDPAALKEYTRLKSLFASGSSFTVATAKAEAEKLKAMVAATPTVPVRVGNAPHYQMIYQLSPKGMQLALLQTALERIATVAAEAERVPTLNPGAGGQSGEHPAAIKGAVNIAALQLDYQVAVLHAAQSTSAYHSGPAMGAVAAVLGRHIKAPRFDNIFDVYGASPPSAIANSQIHHGVATPVFIEDQPTYRGPYFGSVAEATMEYGDIKLLVDNYNETDFGDTHSLVLLVDSLSVQEALLRLDPSADQGVLLSILSASSNAKKETDINGQGKSEYDVLEKALSGLAGVLGVSKSGWIELKPDPKGGTWARYEDYGSYTGRNTFHTDLGKVLASSLYGVQTGHLRVGRSDQSLAMQARTDFGAMTTLLSLSPVSITARDAEGKSALEKSVGSLWGDVYAKWELDRDMVQPNRDMGRETYTQRYLDDRTRMLQWLCVRNAQNKADYADARTTFEVAHYRDVSAAIEFDVGRPNASVVRSQILFGGNAADTLSGKSLQDFVYGGAGGDSLGGQGGDDYLEGNAGDDSLNGGIGDDTLNGGTGSDTYTFDAGWGADTVLDADGKGALQVTGIGVIDGANTKKVAVDAWQSADRRVSYTLVPVAAGRSDLIVSFNDRSDTITIRGWSASKNLGITLPATMTAPPIDRIFNGDFAKQTGPASSYVFDSERNYVSAGAQAGSADLVTGSAKADRINGLAGNDGLAGGAGDDVIDGGDGNDLLLGGLGRDTLKGGAGADFIFGSGKALLYPSRTDTPPPATNGTPSTTGFGWATQLHAGIDIRGQDIYDVVGADVGTLANDAANIIDGGAGNDLIRSGPGADTVHGGTQDDGIAGLGGADLLFGDDGDDKISGDGVVLVGYVETTAAAQHGRDTLAGGAGNDELVGDGNNDELLGGTGNDSLWGDNTDVRGTPVAIHGDDLLDGGDGDDSISGGGKNDALYGGAGKDTLWGDEDVLLLAGSAHGGDYLDGQGGDDYLEAGGGADTVFGGNDNDQLYGDASREGLTADQLGADYLDGGAGRDTLVGDDDSQPKAGGADTLIGGADDDQIKGLGGADALYGDAGNDLLLGGEGADTLVGGSGDDQLEAGEGNDYLADGSGVNYLWGGAGDDTYALEFGDAAAQNWIDDAQGANQLKFAHGLQVSASAAYGADLWARLSDGSLLIITGALNGAIATVDDGTRTRAFGDWLQTVLVDPVSLYGGDGKDVFLAGAAHDALYGGGGADKLSGGLGQDTLDGGLGSDAMAGGLGDDTYWVDTAQDQVSELGDAGIDLIRSRVSYTLGNNLEQVQLEEAGKINATGNALANLLTGNASANVLDGKAGNDTLAGAAGGDTLIGGAGDDVFMVDSTSDVVTEVANEGVDAVQSTLNWTLAANVENLALMEGAAAIKGTGNALGNVIVGNGYANTLDGLQGSDTLIGGDGNDVYGVDSSGDVIVERALEGVDTVRSSVSWTLGVELEKLTLIGTAAVSGTGNALGNDVIGNGAANLLQGAGGQDTLTGAGGADTLVGGAGDDLLVGGLGNDTYRVGLGTGADVIDSLDTTAGKLDTLEFLQGIAPSDVKFSLSLDDLVLSFGNAGDQVRLKGFFNPANTLARRVDRIVFADGTSWNAAALLDKLFKGTAAADTLSGSSLADRIDAGAGDDTVNAGGGADTVLGGAGADAMYGEAGNDTLDGGGGNDVFTGGAGTDTYLFGKGSGQDEIRPGPTVAQDQDTILLGSGIAAADVTFKLWYDDLMILINGTTDQLLVSDFFAVGPKAEGVKTIRFSDGTAWDQAAARARTMIGTPEADRLIGTLGNDTLEGAGGADELVADAGNDLLTGGSENDTLQGGDGNDTLDGGSGADLLNGNTGTDVYLFGKGSGADTIWGGVYFAAPGVNDDTVLLGPGISVADVTLKHILTSYSDLWIGINGTADSLLVQGYFSPDNLFTQGMANVRFADGTVWRPTDIEARAIGATAGDDSLRGGDTTDLIRGGDGADTLRGGKGGDSLFGERGSDQLFGDDGDDTLDGGAGDDTLNGGEGFDLYRFGRGGGHDLVAEWWQPTGANAIVFDAGIAPAQVTATRGQPNESSSLYLTITGSSDWIRVSNYFSNDPQASLAPVGEVRFADGTVWKLDKLKQLVAQGTSAGDYLYGYNGADSLASGAGSDYLDGGLGSDTLQGGAGDDTYIADLNDTIIEKANEGNDTVQSVTDFVLGENIEHLVLLGNADLRGRGNAQANSLIGNAGNDTLDGGAGKDAMSGSFGDDTYIVDNSGDSVIEEESSGGDTVKSSVTWTLAQNVENLTLTGTAAINGSGNALNNTLGGNAAANMLSGGEGADIYDGAGNNDSLVDTSTRSSDTYRWGLGAGSDTIMDSGGSLDHVDLAAGITQDQLVFSRSGNHLRLTIAGQSAQLTINNGYLAANQIEEFRLPNGDAVLASQVHNLINAMAAFNAERETAAVQTSPARRSTHNIGFNVQLVGSV